MKWTACTAKDSTIYFVKERPNDDINARTRYEMSITDNHITLNVDNVVYETVQKDPRWALK